MTARSVAPQFWQRLAAEIEGDVAADLFSRGRYATDASMHQCFPAGVACPRSEADVAIVVEMAREEGLSIVARGGGVSTAGQALGEGLVVDFSKYLNKIIEIGPESLTAVVEPGLTPAALNASLKPHGLFFPVDIASARQASLGGMLGNNACGIRNLRYGRMGDNVSYALALLADGQKVEFGEFAESEGVGGRPILGRDRLLDLLQFGEAHEKEIAELWPKRARGEPGPEGFDLGALLPSEGAQNLARLLAGSEGALAIATRLELRLARRPENRALGVCRFASLGAALRAAPAIAALDPTAVELMDRPLLGFLGPRAAIDPQAARILQGDPEALLLVEFDEDNPVENTRRLKALDGLLAEAGQRQFNLVEVMGRQAQAALWRLRRDALTRAMTLKSAAQPVAFLEDGAVPLERLAAYASAIEALFEKHGVRAVIHGHVGQGCLHIRPILNLKSEQDRARMRALSEAMTELLRKHSGALTSGHGLGLSRAEAWERMRGPRAASLCAQVKSLLDPGNLLNPGKIVRAPRFDDEALLRAPKERLPEPEPGPVSLVWEAAPSPSRALDHARRCSGLGLCRATDAPFACPSYGVTKDERDSPRGRANTVRLALSGQLGEAALGSEAMIETMRLCVSCKACKVQCPHGVDVAKMKVEALSAARARGRISRAEALYARLPLYTGTARRWRALLRLRDLLPGLPRLSERHLGFAADRRWPKWSGRPFKAPREAEPGPKGLVALLADTFNQSFEPENLRAAANVLGAAGYGVVAFADEDEERPLCCGRTFYDAGYIEEAREHAQRFARALAAFKEKGVPVIGLEPACVLMARDEYAALGAPVDEGAFALLFEEFVAARLSAGDFALPLKPVEAELLLQSHCHERVLGLEKAALAALGMVPGLSVKEAPPSCCGLNGHVGMTAETFEASLAMAEIALFPAIRKAGRDALVAASGFSCRKQIQDGLGRPARHPVRILDLALKSDSEIVT